MPYDYQEKVAQNLIGNVPPTNKIFQIVPPQNYFQTPPPCAIPIPFCAIPQPQNAQNQMQLYPVRYYPQNKAVYHSGRPKLSFSDQHVNSTGMQYSRPIPSPIKSPSYPNKRHKFHETISSGSDQSSNDNNSDQCSSNSEGKSGLEVDSIFYELQCFALDGCTFAENVSKNYRKRPCFKKIELLLSRLKQELNVHHNIISNINSQGTAWAIKDFVFVFSRIVNAWIIMRGYIYDKAEGLDELRKEYDADFIESFTEWQQATLKMMKTLMGTVENLDILTQNKSGNKQKKKEAFSDLSSEVKQYDQAFLENFQKDLFNPKCAENSEEVQIRNHETRAYFRAGILKPLQMQNALPSGTMCISPLSTPTTPDTDILNWLSYDDLNETPFNISSNSKSDRLYNRKSVSLPVTPMDQANPFDISDKSRAKKDLSAKFNTINVMNSIEAELEKEFGKLEINENVTNDDNGGDEEKLFEKMYKEEGRKILYLVNEVSKMSQNDCFTLCINMVIENVKKGKYANLSVILDEFKILVKHAKNMAESTKEGDKNSLMKFVSGLEAIINRKAFE